MVSRVSERMIIVCRSDVVQVVCNNCKRRSLLKNRQASEREGVQQNIFNLRILCEKCFQHQQDLYHVFIDFKKAFDRFGMQLCGQP